MIKLNYISSTTSPPWGRDDKIKLHILHYQPSLGGRGDKIKLHILHYQPSLGGDDKIKLHILHYQLSLGER